MRKMCKLGWSYNVRFFENKIYLFQLQGLPPMLSQESQSHKIWSASCVYGVTS